eukprot:m.107867 g.107867  ORF g.107867 m.107867 type:complete len:102 (+) comp37306_c0_seq29:2225-2530(+)
MRPHDVIKSRRVSCAPPPPRTIGRPRLSHNRHSAASVRPVQIDPSSCETLPARLLHCIRSPASFQGFLHEAFHCARLHRSSPSTSAGGSVAATAAKYSSNG